MANEQAAISRRGLVDVLRRMDRGRFSIMVLMNLGLIVGALLVAHGIAQSATIDTPQDNVARMAVLPQADADKRVRAAPKVLNDSRAPGITLIMSERVLTPTLSMMRGNETSLGYELSQASNVNQ